VIRRTTGSLRLAFDRRLVLGDLAERVASIDPKRTFVVEGDWTPTTADIAVLVDQWSDRLRSQIAPGDRVVLATPNGARQWLACLAASRAGAIAVPVNPAMRSGEIEHVVADASAALVVRDVAELDARPTRTRTRTSRARAAPTRADPKDLAALFYTSGTTGTPKGVRLSHRALLDVGPVALLAGIPGRREMLAALPVAHIMGFATFASAALAGVTIRSLPRFTARGVLDALEQHRCTAFVGVPAMYREMLDAGAEQRDLRGTWLWISGADVMPPALAKRFQAMGAFGRATFLEGYGLAESAGAVALKARVPVPVLDRLLPDDGVGVALPGVRMRVRDGELEVKAPSVTSGYWGDAAATREALTDDGWLRTGDRVTLGPFRTLRFEGRAKDVLKVGGYSVYAVELEAVLREHPAVSDVAVVGSPDERLGEVPVAAVVLAPGADATPEKIEAFAHERLSGYKRIRQVTVVDDLPRNGTGKVVKARVRTQLGL
jgi:acyl-CoA synthetase (AMP-forming)/AMP-acid ligase II